MKIRIKLTANYNQIIFGIGIDKQKKFDFLCFYKYCFRIGILFYQLIIFYEYK